MNRFWKILYQFLFVAFIAGIIGWVILWERRSNGPLQPNPEAGQIIQYDNHGTIHYITRTEESLSFWLMLVNPMLGLVMAGIKWRLSKDPIGR